MSNPENKNKRFQQPNFVFRVDKDGHWPDKRLVLDLEVFDVVGLVDSVCNQIARVKAYGWFKAS